MLAERHGDDLDEEGRTFLGHVREEAARMKSMIDDLLDYSRLETRGGGARTGRRSARRPGHRPQDARAADRGDRARGSTWTGTLPVVEGSPVQFERLFRNLIGNALKFRGEEPPVVTRVGANGPTTSGWSCVRDNGIGIDPAQGGADLRGVPAPPQPGRVRRHRAWDSRSASGSSSATAAGSGSSPLRTAAARSSSPCRS